MENKSHQAFDQEAIDDEDYEEILESKAKKKSNKFVNKLEQKKESHLRSVQEGSILYYFYKAINIISDLVIAARDTMSVAFESKYENQDKTNKEN